MHFEKSHFIHQLSMKSILCETHYSSKSMTYEFYFFFKHLLYYNQDVELLIFYATNIEHIQQKP